MGAKGLDLRDGLVIGGGWGSLDHSGDPRMHSLRGSVLEVGDMLFFDKVARKYVIVKKADVAAVLSGGFDTDRYTTNHDTHIGTLDGVARFVAKDDAMPEQSLYNNSVAATSCYYRIEINNNNDGKLEFTVASGNGNVSGNITWTSGAQMEDIVADFVQLNNTSAYITFDKLADRKGVGLEVGGYGANILTVVSSVGCKVIDCSSLAVDASKNGEKAGDEYIEGIDYAYINKNHNNFRGAAAATLIPGRGLVAANTVLEAVSGYNYSYRCGGKFAKFLSWAETNGDNAFYPDGTDGFTVNPGPRVMKKTAFTTYVEEFEPVDQDNPTEEEKIHLRMLEFYKHLYNDDSGDYAELRHLYESRYGTMNDEYFGYLMNHMVDPAAASGITAAMRGKGKNQSDVKGAIMNVTYDYIFIPAYPPEYNAINYGDSGIDGFAPGTYYHPEPADIGLFMRDDIMSQVNVNIALVGGTSIVNTVSRGSCADYYSTITWYFSSYNGCVYNNYRYYTYFRARPILALPV